MNDRDWRFADAARVIDQSVTMQSVKAVCSAVEAADAGSRAAGSLRSATSAFRLAPLAMRVQHLAILVATACLTHIALMRWMPLRLAPAVPVAWWIAAAVAAAAVAAAAGPLTNAWRHRRGVP
jgi:hypothetical protein